ncbi:MAG TPA: folate family ECF transporter S component [Clostridia bacterium]|nr:folate family ECF transporter S component [Clostridia bacterium]
MQKKLGRVLAVALCAAIPCALYAYFSKTYTADAESPDFLIMAGIFLPWIGILSLMLRLWQSTEERLWTREKTRRLVVCALLTALGVVLGGLLSIPAMPLGTYSLKIGFGVLPVILTGVLFGPAYGAMVGGLTDFLQALIFPKGAYVPFFTVIGTFFGLIPGLFFARGQEAKFPRVLLAVAAGQMIASVALNSLLLIWLYGLPWETFIPRVINQAVMIPVYSVLVYYCVKLLKKAGVARPGL